MCQRREIQSWRGVRIILWGLAIALIADVALILGMELLPRLKDPEYGKKLVRLRAAIAAKPNRPLVLLLGNSRIGTGIRPDYLTGAWSAPNSPVVFNFGLCASGPVLQLLCLQRLLDQGIHPNWVMIEIWWPQLVDLGWSEADYIQVPRLQVRDLALVGRYHSEPERLYSEWLGLEMAPWWSHRGLLMNQFAPQLVANSCRMDLNWDGLDKLGWLLIPPFDAGSENPGWQSRTEAVIKSYSPCFGDLPINPKIDAALREILEKCSRQQIRTSFLLMPDRFRVAYIPAARARFNDYLGRLGREYGSPVLDTRDWVADTGFHDGVHQTPQSAAVYSTRLGRELIQPLLADQKVAQVQTGR